jgi:hypothetical protein
MGNGFSVAPGTALIGAVFPNSVVSLGTYNGVPIPNPGWSADLLVTGDPREAMAAYRDQAISAGFSMEPARCGREDAGETGFYSCEANGSSNTTEDRRAVTIWIMRGKAPFGAMSHMKIQYSGDYAGIPIDGSTEPNTEPQVRGPSPSPVPTNWEPLAQPGDFVFGDSAKAPLTFMAPPFTVEPGSELAAPIGPSGTYGSYDWTAVLNVTGDPAQVANAYRAQLDARSRTFGTVGTVVESRPATGVTSLEFGADNPGAWDYRFEILHGPNGSWMRVRAGAQT